MKLFQSITRHRNWHPVLSITLKFFALFAMLRLVFFVSHKELFQPFDFKGFSEAFIYGAVLDAMAIFYGLSILLVLLHLLKYRRVFLTLFTIMALIFTTFSVIDTLYFAFSKEHLGAELLWQMEGDNNISPTAYILDYIGWFVGILLFVGLFAAWISRNMTAQTLKGRSGWVSFLVIACTFFIARGGWRSKPMRSTDIGQYVNAPFNLLGINTSVYLYESSLHPIEIPANLSAVQPTIKAQTFGRTVQRLPNVVVLVLESFGKEYTGMNGGVAPSYTPNLDTLARSSVVCQNAYANGLKSLDAVPAIFSGMPKVNTTSFIHSPQSTKALPSLYNCLGELGYHTSFFHGGNNNSMGFRSYLKNQGLEHYYGQDEMKHIPNSHDGHWGIFDHIAFDFFIDKLDEFPEPFVSGIFTLSSHHPYPIPEAFANQFPKGSHDIHETIGYTDHALGAFFSRAKGQSWFKNTVFIITADHSAVNTSKPFLTPSGKYAIPLLIYAPGLVQTDTIHKSVSQMDILPTVLALAGYPKSVLMLGQDVLGPQSSGVIHYDNNAYHYTDSNWVVGIAQNDIKSLYNKTDDLNCTRNLKATESAKASRMKAALYQQLRNYEEVLSQTHN